MEKTGSRGIGVKGEPVRVVFCGTPAFAVPTLLALHERGVHLVQVVTQPDRPRGRGQKPAPSPVKTAADRLGLSVLQPYRIRDPEVVRHLASSAAHALVLVAYGQILPKGLLDAFPFGALNVHPSLLPKYRGAAPIQRTILHGDTETGVSIMLMDEGMDTGPILAVERVPIKAHDTFGTLHDTLARVGADLLCRTLEAWVQGRCHPVAQDDSQTILAPPIQKHELHINWQEPAAAVCCRIRAFDPWPGAFGFHGSKRIKFFHARLSAYTAQGRPGEVLGLCRDGLLVCAGDGTSVAVGRLQVEARRPVSADAFLRGYDLPIGSTFA
ncbi:MAG: methionyl-tRNA formyltransferase [Desulfosoma sp.]|uniref:methionyl-tRNA formyltransferase n=1 Tax=Desulfosoma sp. TaxID=2603217 RepID=UPI00404A0099